MQTFLYCFRDDFRLHDNQTLLAACQDADRLLPVWLTPTPVNSPWRFARVGGHHRAFPARAAGALDSSLRRVGSRPIVQQGSVTQARPALADTVNTDAIYCEDTLTPNEADDLHVRRQTRIQICSHWQCTLFTPGILPWKTRDLPDVFTRFWQKIERARLAPLPLQLVITLPSVPETTAPMAGRALPVFAMHSDSRSSLPFPQTSFLGGEDAALAHLEQYLASGLPHSYKAPHNGLSGINNSRMLSHWRAGGALCSRLFVQQLRRFEAAHGASDSNYRLWFERLWRDYCKLLQLKYGKRLHRAGGLPGIIHPAHDEPSVNRWRQGVTEQPLGDASMRELATTGYLGNCMRKIVASYLIHELQCNWRAGAAWFKSALTHYDRTLNQGNWLYITGLGSDPRSGRRFNPDKQATQYGADGAYQAIGGTS